MSFSEQDLVDIERLIFLLENTIVYLKGEGCVRESYGALEKSINILKNKDFNGMRKVGSYIMSDFRMMTDRGQYGENIDDLTNEVIHILRSNELFSN